MLKFYIAFSKISKFGPKKFYQLRKYFPTIEAGWRAPADELMQAGLDQQAAEEFAILRREINPDEELEKLHAAGAKAVTCDDENYPALLKQIAYPPFLLYYRGELANLHEQAIAVVGTRKMTSYGKAVTPQIVEALCAQGIIIVSGLAIGVDSLAHLSALRQKATTVAVLGSGIDDPSIYPATNRALAEQIIANNGIIISEYPIATPALKHHFPARNRLISGLALGTLVIEAGEESGALITAYFSLEQNREVFAVPGNIVNPMSAGCNALIKKGAKLVSSAEDIFDELNLQSIKTISNNRESIPDSAEEAALLKCLQNEAKHINELVQLSGLTMTEANTALTLLEMKGRVKNISNVIYLN